MLCTVWHQGVMSRIQADAAAELRVADTIEQHFEVCDGAERLGESRRISANLGESRLSSAKLG